MIPEAPPLLRIEGLSVEFRGGNVAFFGVRQVVSVEGGRRYRLSALVRTDGVTSLSGPRLLRPAAVDGVRAARMKGATRWEIAQERQETRDALERPFAVEGGQARDEHARIGMERLREDVGDRR